MIRQLDDFFSRAEFDPTPAAVRLAADIDSARLRSRKGPSGWTVTTDELFLDADWEEVGTRGYRVRRELVIDSHRLGSRIVTTASVFTHSLYPGSTSVSRVIPVTAFGDGAHDYQARLWEELSPRSVTEKWLFTVHEKALHMRRSLLPRIAQWALSLPPVA